MDWRHRAICRDEDPELFFPVTETGPGALHVAEAKTVCRRCPVVSECLAWALDSGQEYGVWGGMTESERRLLLRPLAERRARQSAPQRHARAAEQVTPGRAYRYGTCPDCMRRHPRRIAGGMGQHNRFTDAGWQVCTGIGKDPVEGTATG